MEAVKLPAVKMVPYNQEHWYDAEHEKGLVYVPSTTTYLGIVNKPGMNHRRGELGNNEFDRISTIAKNKGSNIHHAWEIANLGGAVLYEVPYRSPMAERTWTPETVKPFIEKYGKRWLIVYDQDEYEQFLKLQEWETVINPTQIETEVSLSDFDLNIGGTIDRVIRIEPGTYKVAGRTPLVIEGGGGDCLVDLKTGKDVWPENYLQLAGYRKLWEKATGRTVAYGLIIHSNARTRTGIEGLTTYVRTPEQMDIDWYHLENIMRVWWWHRASDARPSVKDLPSHTSYELGKKAIPLEVSGDQTAEKVQKLKKLVKNVEKGWKK